MLTIRYYIIALLFELICLRLQAFLIQKIITKTRDKRRKFYKSGDGIKIRNRNASRRK